MSGSLALVYPVLAQLFLTFVVVAIAGRARLRAVRHKDVRIRDIALSGEAWPDVVKQRSNNMHNQYETPILFYVLCAVATYIGATGTWMAGLAWAYVVSRAAHSAVHMTTNRVSRRFLAFMFGFVVLILMWISIVAMLLTA